MERVRHPLGRKQVQTHGQGSIWTKHTGEARILANLYLNHSILDPLTLSGGPLP